MKKQLSSMDAHFLVKELGQLKGSRIDKIYQPEDDLIIFSFHKANEGRKILKIKVGTCAYIIDEKENYDETLGFGMFLRKHLDGYFLDGVEQLEPERILKFTFKIKDEKKFFYLEFFGKGNAILCSENNAILNALEHHDFRERSIRPKLKYVYPMMNYNLFELKDLNSVFKNSKKDSLITSLAIELGLGGLYAEETCLLSNADKTINPKNIDDNTMHSILNSLNKIINKEIDAYSVFENGLVIDVIPFDMEFYKSRDKRKFSSFSEALSFFYLQFKEIKETEFDKKLKNLQRIIEEQKQTIEAFRIEETELREKGELIYQKYALIKEILDELNKASKKYSWKEIKEKVKGHNLIKELNDKDRKVVVEV